MDGNTHKWVFSFADFMKTFTENVNICDTF